MSTVTVTKQGDVDCYDQATQICSRCMIWQLVLAHDDYIWIEKCTGVCMLEFILLSSLSLKRISTVTCGISMNCCLITLCNCSVSSLCTIMLNNYVGEQCSYLYPFFFQPCLSQLNCPTWMTSWIWNLMIMSDALGALVIIYTFTTKDKE